MTAKLDSDLLILNMVTEWIGQQEVLVLFTFNYNNFWENNCFFFLHGLPIPIFEHLTITTFDRSVIESFKFCLMY